MLLGLTEQVHRWAARRGERGCHEGVELLSPDSANTAFTVGVRRVRCGATRPLAAHAASLHAVAIPGETATLPAEATAAAALDVGLPAVISGSVAEALADIVAQDPASRILICGSLYLAGSVLRENG